MKIPPPKFIYLLVPTFPVWTSPPSSFPFHIIYSAVLPKTFLEPPSCLMVTHIKNILALLGQAPALCGCHYGAGIPDRIIFFNEWQILFGADLEAFEVKYRK